MTEAVADPEVSKSPFIVLVPEPQKVYIDTLAMQAAGSKEKRFRPVRFPSGLLTDFKGQVIYPNGLMELFGQFQYRSSYAGQSYWTEEEAKALREILHMNAGDRKTYIQDVGQYSNDKVPSWQVSFLHHKEGLVLTSVTLGHITESNQWKEKVSIIQAHRKVHPEFAQLHREEDEAIINNASPQDPLPNTGLIIHTLTAALSDRPTIQNERAFSNYLEAFRGDTEDIIRAIADVKQIPQAGLLSIR